MSDLIAVVLDSREQAQEARLEFMKMQREHLVELEDCVVAYKDDTGQVKLDQTLNLTATGAAAGGFWGLFLGLLLSIPFGGLLLPIMTAVFGAGFGASLLLDSRVLRDEELNERRQQCFASLADVMHKLEETEIQREFFL
jgi:uncharacterized membrane protein